MISGDKRYKNVTNPYAIPIPSGLKASRRAHSQHVGQNNRDIFTKMIFMREPYSRLLATYVDKLLAPNPIFWRDVSQHALKITRGNVNILKKGSVVCAHDLTFKEFIKFAIHVHDIHRQIDSHIVSINVQCSPCFHNYDIIGKMETFRMDAFSVFRRFGLNDTIRNMEKTFESDYEMDAVLDSINSPFSWMGDITKCMEVDEGLKRIWRKLQIRGMLALENKFPFANSVNVTANRFIDEVVKARSSTSKSLRKLSRNRAKIEIFRTVPIEDMRKLQQIYKLDFEMFEYDKEPRELYNREPVDKVYGYLDIAGM